MRNLAYLLVGAVMITLGAESAMGDENETKTDPNAKTLRAGISGWIQTKYAMACCAAGEETGEET
jgi:hypothetical protein